jgi:hypothetical protein
VLVCIQRVLYFPQELRRRLWNQRLAGNGLTQAAIDRAYAERAILRTHVMRPTWHVVLSALA